MKTLLLLCLNFFKTGLFAVGGGLATLPFITDMSNTHPDWFTKADIANMVAVSESTPGPIGINMATYVGYHMFGVPGAILTSLSLVLPSFLIILAIVGIMDKYSENRIVKAVFAGLRPAAVGLIAAAGFSVLLIALFPGYSGSTVFDMSGITALFSWKALALFAVISTAVQLPKLKDLHPVVYIAIAALVGIVFRF
ncbi:MAG: chromate transporter [Eubacteriales bacterium]|nr:chromate transporter [Eubacteriales bacterium]MDO5452908.1 chromate transporter [Eubacteriales bacterium]